MCSQSIRDAASDAAMWGVVLLVQEQGSAAVTTGLQRPLAWLADRGIDRVGAWTDLDLPEMGAEGAFQVAAIEACPSIEGGAGRIVTGVYAHRRGMVYDLRVAGVVDPIGVTALHPFWSVDRNDWIPVSELLYGERLAIEGATGVVLGVTERGEEPVYNLEVDGDHCYRVGERGVLVHNESESCHLFPKSFSGGWDIPKINPPIVGTGGRVEGIQARINKVVSTDRPDLENPRCWQTCWNQDLPKGKSKVARCHLLGHVLGGSNNQDNLVPCCQKANLEQWNVAKKQIRDYIRDNPGAVVDIKVTVHYGMSPLSMPHTNRNDLGRKGVGL